MPFLVQLLTVPRPVYDAVCRALIAAGHRERTERENDPPALDMHGLALIAAVDVVKLPRMPAHGEIKQASNQLYVWKVSPTSGETPGAWVELATFDKSSEAAYVGAIVERAMRLAHLVV